MASQTEERDLALRAVGRTVVNFQRLEACLKRLAKLQPLEGTIPDIRSKYQRRSELLTKSTLGNAIAGWVNVLDSGSTRSHLPEDLIDATARFAFSLDLDEDRKTRHLDALNRLLDERNSLVHEELLAIDWDSSEECRKLTTKLDAQNDRIRTELEFLVSVLRAISEAASNLDDEELAAAMLEVQRQTPNEQMPVEPDT